LVKPEATVKLVDARGAVGAGYSVSCRTAASFRSIIYLTAELRRDPPDLERLKHLDTLLQAEQYP
jgi:hypothetical protein